MPAHSLPMNLLNVLVADDNKYMRTLVKNLLYTAGVKIVNQVSDGADAIKELRHFDADVVICDWNMSPVDGLDFLRLLRNGNDALNIYVPVIILTCYTEMQYVIKARDAGANDLLAKPVSAKDLLSRINDVILRPRNFVKTFNYFGPQRRGIDEEDGNDIEIIEPPVRPIYKYVMGDKNAFVDRNLNKGRKTKSNLTDNNINKNNSTGGLEQDLAISENDNEQVGSVTQEEINALLQDK